MLSNRIRSVLHEVIDGKQYAFIKGRNILGSILIANERVEDYKRRKQKGVVVKLDLEKANDKTDCKFLDYVIARKDLVLLMGFWMPLFARFSVIINRSPHGFFSASRGLRQGKPLSPFLFTLVADSLSQIIINAESKSLIKGFLVETELMFHTFSMWTTP